ncbi:uncharacterized protein LOC115441685 [Manduca sexta]|uniref:uncharacterized protein LOC115441685 n=1 Tax=Manduca sexta TaxID=7130 RepID=UPI0018904DD7|nr:uncharacterized protein LOC115441685 [Manduca sexta]
MMKFVIISIVVTMSVCLTDCWRVFPLEIEPTVKSVSAQVPKFVTTTTTPTAFVSTTVADVKSSLSSDAPDAVAPKFYEEKTDESIRPPSVDLIPPKEGGADY